MKLHSLNMTAFGPFAGTVEIPFDALDQGAPFLLTGPTGSGKTTILDAVCFALYGRIPRAGGSVPDVVSRFRSEGTEPSVEVELTIGSERLRVRRTPTYTRSKLRGEGKTTAQTTASLWILNGTEPQAIASKPSDVDREINDRLRMNVGQFSQVVMLPQGEFSKFLRADAHERRRLLERLFPGENLSEVQEWLENEADEVRNQRDERRREIEDAITAAWSVVSEAWVERSGDPPAMPGPLDPEGLSRTVNEVDAILVGDRDRTAQAEQTAHDGWAEADGRYSQLKERRRLVEQRGLEEDRRKELMAKSDRIEGLRARSRTAGRAAVVYPLAEAAARRSQVADQAAKEREERLAELDAETDIDSLDPRELEARGRDLRDSETTFRNFEDTELPRGREREARCAELKLLEEQLTNPGSPALAALEKSSVDVETREAALGEARRRRLHIRECRNAGMAAELAGALVEGEPCVVCGSTEHPSPARAEAGQELFEKSDEDAAEQAVAAATETLDSVKAKLAEIKAGVEKQRTQTASELKACEEEIAALRADEEKLLEGAASIGERREAVGLIADRIEATLRAIKSEATAVKEREESAREAGRSASENGFEDVDSALAARLDPEELERINAEVNKFDEDLAAVRHRLDEGELKSIKRDEEVPLPKAKDVLADASMKRDKAIAAATTSRNRFETFTTNTGEVDSKLGELEPLTVHCERVSGLAATALGRNAKRIQLCNFVLAARLQQVIAAANSRLGPMSGDRYALKYEEAAEGGGPAGLGIRIFDAHISEERSTKTLSGGETFYCSLALALGLAEVVQIESGGRSLETLFIDEGFGTLDSETLNQVMNQIENLRANGRSVGLVSHVEEMRTRISAQIQVTPSRTGSKLELVGV